MKDPFAQSVAHRHTADSPCLEAVTEVPNGLGFVNLDIPSLQTAVEPGWYRCKETVCGITGYPYWVHDHGGRFVSHFPNAADSRFAVCAS